MISGTLLHLVGAVLLASVFQPAAAAEPLLPDEPMPPPDTTATAGETPWSHVPVSVGNPVSAAKGDAGVDRFEPDMRRIEKFTTTDGVVIVALNGEGMEHLQLLRASDGRLTLACASVLERASGAAPADFRWLNQRRESGRALR